MFLFGRVRASIETDKHQKWNPSNLLWKCLLSVFCWMFFHKNSEAKRVKSGRLQCHRGDTSARLFISGSEEDSLRFSVTLKDARHLMDMLTVARSAQWPFVHESAFSLSPAHPPFIPPSFTQLFQASPVSGLTVYTQQSSNNISGFIWLVVLPKIIKEKWAQLHF